jgi:ABC-type dipeptide/oligopeptide/nickel transport system ATPase component
VAWPRLERGALTPIPGAVPQLIVLPPGCAFEPRCAVRRAECVQGVPDLCVASSQHTAPWYSYRKSVAVLLGALETDGEHLLIVGNDFFS